MINFNTFGYSLKRGIRRFSEKISKGLAKPTQKFITEMAYGIITSKSAKLTEIGRALKEDISLNKTVTRLSRNLKDFSSEETEILKSNYIVEVLPKLGDSTMILVDASDATKPCSREMECLGTVYDGSKGKFGDGYWTIGAVALTDEIQQPIPVYEKLYPCIKQGGQGFNVETENALDALRQNFDNSIPRVFDRGFDSKDVIKNLISHSEKFIIRVSQLNRVCIHKGKRTYIKDVVRGLECNDKMMFESKTGNKSECCIGMTQVFLPGVDNVKVNLIVCKNFGENPLVLYTNIDENLEALAVRIVKAYLMRWRIEEYHALKKEEGLDFEDFRVRSLRAIQTLDLLFTIVIGYIGLVCAKGKNDELFLNLVVISKRVRSLNFYLNKTKFFCFAILDGFSTVFKHLKYGIWTHSVPDSSQVPNQLSLF